MVTWCREVENDTSISGIFLRMGHNGTGVNKGEQLRGIGACNGPVGQLCVDKFVNLVWIGRGSLVVRRAWTKGRNVGRARRESNLTGRAAGNSQCARGIN